MAGNMTADEIATTFDVLRARITKLEEELVQLRDYKVYDVVQTLERYSEKFAGPNVLEDVVKRYDECAGDINNVHETLEMHAVGLHAIEKRLSDTETDIEWIIDSRERVRKRKRGSDS